MGRKRSLPPGVRPKRGRWQLFITVNGQQYTTTVDVGTSKADRDEWREDMIEQHGGVADAAGGFGALLPIYESRVSAMPTLKQRMAHLDIWADVLGRDTTPNSVTDVTIDALLQGWLDDGLAPGTVKKRRTSLQSFYKKMNGKHGKNPVKGTAIPKEPEAEVRSIDYAAIERAIAAMPDGRDTKKGLPPRVSLSKIRAGVLAYTGIPPGLLKKVQRHDLVLVGDRGTVRVPARIKGKGVAARTLKLTGFALAWFKLFHAANAYGYFATESLNRSFKRGCQKAGLDPKAVHLYDLRHSFLTMVYRVTRDRSTVERLGLHKAGSVCSARYTLGANEDVDEAAVAAFDAALATVRRQSMKGALPQKPAKRTDTSVTDVSARSSVRCNNSTNKVPAKSARSRKSFKQRRLRAVS